MQDDQRLIDSLTSELNEVDRKLVNINARIESVEGDGASGSIEEDEKQKVITERDQMQRLRELTLKQLNNLGEIVRSEQLSAAQLKRQNELKELIKKGEADIAASIEKMTKLNNSLKKVETNILQFEENENHLYSVLLNILDPLPGKIKDRSEARALLRQYMEKYFPSNDAFLTIIVFMNIITQQRMHYFLHRPNKLTIKNFIWDTDEKGGTFGHQRRIEFTLKSGDRSLPANTEWNVNWHGEYTRKDKPHIDDLMKILHEMNQRRLTYPIRGFYVPQQPAVKVGAGFNYSPPLHSPAHGSTMKEQRKIHKGREQGSLFESPEDILADGLTFKL